MIWVSRDLFVAFWDGLDVLQHAELVAAQVPVLG